MLKNTKMLNINNSDDNDYRYKMQTISFKMGGAGNGIFTTIDNMDAIAKSINTPSDIICKFISFTLGTSYNDKKKQFTGHHYNIQDIIFDYINNFVICPECKIPELMYNLDKINSKKFKLICRCSACGSINDIKPINKIIDKSIDTIVKYLNNNNNIWIVSKGFMVQQKN
jgi:translation initiation factor 5